jgi:type IV pilus assembly protein PilA
MNEYKLKVGDGGFTLIELMIVVAIVGILTAIAIPQYSNYVSRTRAVGAVAELYAFKSSVGECAHSLQTVVGCNGGTNGIPPVAGFVTTQNVPSLTSVVDGVVSAVTGATQSNGGPALLITIAPTFDSASANMRWVNTGSICTNPLRGLKSGSGDCP